MTMYRAKHLAKQGRRPLCVLLALVVLATVFTTLRLPAQAAGAPTSLGLAEHGLMKRASMVADCGMPSEAVWEHLEDAPETSGYFTIVVVRRGENAT